MSVVRSPTQLSVAFALANKAEISDIVETLSILISQASQAITERTSSIMASFPYATGEMLVIGNQTKEVQQIGVFGTLGSTGTNTFPLFSSSVILPTNVTIVSITGVAQNGVTAAYPIGYSVSGNALSASVDITNASVVVTYTAFFFGFNIQLLVKYA